MDKRIVMKCHWFIAAFAVILLVAIVVLSVHQHEMNERVFLSYFQEHQLLHAHHVADQIETLLSGHRHFLQVLPSFPSDLMGDMEHIRADVQAYSSNVERDYINKISLYDKKGAIFYSTDSNVIGLKEDRKPQGKKGKKRESNGGRMLEQNSNLFSCPG